MNEMESKKKAKSIFELDVNNLTATSIYTMKPIVDCLMD